MKQGALVLLFAAVTIAGCAQSAGSFSPNDPQYARTGAPRAGEPLPQPGQPYSRILGSDGQDGSR